MITIHQKQYCRRHCEFCITSGISAYGTGGHSIQKNNTTNLNKCCIAPQFSVSHILAFLNVENIKYIHLYLLCYLREPHSQF